jgi:hypothetical protein
MASGRTVLPAIIASLSIAVATWAGEQAYGSAHARPAGVISGSTLTHAWNADGTAQDSVGHDNGTLLRGASYARGPDGGSDEAFNIAGDRQQVRFNHRGGNFDRHDFTVSFDILTSAQQKQAVIEKRPVCDAASFWDIRLDGNGLVQPALMSDRFATDNTPGFTSTTSVADGLWHTIVLSRAGRTVSLYIDGNLEATATTAHRIYLVNDSRLRIGMSICVGHDGTLPFQGKIDDVRLYSSALAPADLS